MHSYEFVNILIRWSRYVLNIEWSDSSTSLRSYLPLIRGITPDWYMSLFKEHGRSLASWSIMRSSFVTFFLLHNKLLQVSIWLGPWIVSLLRVLTTSKHQCVDLWSICVSGYSRSSVFWEYPVYPNIAWTSELENLNKWLFIFGDSFKNPT